MKNYRDLVLSSKEPKFHNVLWIKPISRGVYKIYMYEGDGWTPLYGGDGSAGLNYRILKSLPDGYTIQLRDELDVKNLYPKTLTSNVYNSAGKNVDTLIAEINQAIENALANVKKAIFVNQEGLDRWGTDRAGLSFLVYNPSQSVGGYEAFIRQYTTATGPWDYKIVPLYKGDIVMNISNTGLDGTGDKEATMYYVEEIIQAPRHAVLKAVVNTEVFNAAIEDLGHQIENSREVTIDGKIYQSENLRWRVKKCYVVNENDVATFTPVNGRYYAIKRSDTTYLTEIRYYTAEYDDYFPVDFEVGDVFITLYTTSEGETVETPYMILCRDGETVTVEKITTQSQLESYLHIATSESAGIVKGGGDININNDGTMYFDKTTVPRAAEFITSREELDTILNPELNEDYREGYYIFNTIAYDINSDGEINVSDIANFTGMYQEYYDHPVEFVRNNPIKAALMDVDNDGIIDEEDRQALVTYVMSMQGQAIYTPGYIYYIDSEGTYHTYVAKEGYLYTDIRTEDIYYRNYKGGWVLAYTKKQINKICLYIYLQYSSSTQQYYVDKCTFPDGTEITIKFQELRSLISTGLIVYVKKGTQLFNLVQDRITRLEFACMDETVTLKPVSGEIEVDNIGEVQFTPTQSMYATITNSNNTVYLRLGDDVLKSGVLQDALYGDISHYSTPTIQTTANNRLGAKIRVVVNNGTVVICPLISGIGNSSRYTVNFDSIYLDINSDVVRHKEDATHELQITLEWNTGTNSELELSYNMIPL